mmetsp:Transcript_16854/g.56975  ORF Transcript_16854/g.56975 Transcript_16854/m.56975 type:complete len:291 (-) Transcript_16854:238-1110(-)
MPRCWSTLQSKNDVAESQNRFSGHSEFDRRAINVTVTCLGGCDSAKAYLVSSLNPRPAMTRSEYARTKADLEHGVFQLATVMGAAAPRMAIAAFSKQTFFCPYFCAMSQAVKGSRPPKKTEAHMGQKGPRGYRSVTKICNSCSGQPRTAKAMNVLMKSSELWKKFANVSRSTMSVGAVSVTSQSSASTGLKALNQLTFHPGKLVAFHSLGTVSHVPASEPLVYAILENCCWCLESTYFLKYACGVRPSARSRKLKRRRSPWHNWSPPPLWLFWCARKQSSFVPPATRGAQ